MAELSVQFGGQLPGYRTKRMSTGYVGNYIYEPRTGGWYSHTKRQKTTKLSKHHQQKSDKNIAPLESPHEEELVQGQSSESGYDTNGDAQTPRKHKQSAASSSSMACHDGCSSTSAGDEGKRNDKIDQDSCGNLNNETKPVATENSALHKVLRDLNRCDVSIQRYKTALQQHCSDGEVKIKELFSMLHKHLQTRERDLLQELTTIKQTAGSILERRKATLECLREAAANYTQLEEDGVEEIRSQIKQFVTDRKVDEEIGNIQRFDGDMDDLLPHIMGFGKINNVRHLYTEWEEFPSQLIIRSKNKVTFLPASNSEKPSTQKDESNDDPLPTHVIPSRRPQQISPSNSEQRASKRGEGKSMRSGTSRNTRESLSLPLCAANSHSTPHSPRFSKNHRKDTEDKANGEGQREKYSPVELKVIQERVKSSLERQGVFLYDPVTGAGPPARTGSSSSTVKQSSNGVGGRASVDGETRKSEGEDTERDKRKKEMAEDEQAARKKKTPTQQRRERKKRQKEREKRQREREKVGSEESDAQAITPPPPLEAAQGEWSPSTPSSTKPTTLSSLAVLAAKVALEF